MPLATKAAGFQPASTGTRLCLVETREFVLCGSTHLATDSAWVVPRSASITFDSEPKAFSLVLFFALARLLPGLKPTPFVTIKFDNSELIWTRYQPATLVAWGNAPGRNAARNRRPERAAR